MLALGRCVALLTSLSGQLTLWRKRNGVQCYLVEVVRDQALFVGSLLAAELEPRLRPAAGASSWQVHGIASLGGQMVP